MAPPKKPSHQRVSSNPFKNNSNKKPDPDEEVGTIDTNSILTRCSLLHSCLPSSPFAHSFFPLYQFHTMPFDIVILTRK